MKNANAKSDFFKIFFLIILISALLLQPTAIVSAQTPPAPASIGPMGLDWIDDQCPPGVTPPCTQPNPYCIAAHRSMRGAVDQAIQFLGGPGAAQLQNQADHTQNCGPGLIVELAAVFYMNMTRERVYLLSKNYGRACNGHSEDVIVFSDGCAFDVIGAAGSPQQREAMIPLCCGTPPDTTDGGCFPINQPRFMDPPNAP